MNGTDAHKAKQTEATTAAARLARLIRPVRLDQLRSLILVGAVVSVAGCEGYFTTGGDVAGGDTASAGDVGLFRGAEVGESCTETTECRKGLVCDAGSCKPSGAGLENDACILSAECGKDLHCGFLGFCVPSYIAADHKGDDVDPNAGKDGAQCTSASDCETGLVCELAGFSGFCRAPNEGAGSLYAACEGTLDCMAGLTCGADSADAAKRCVPGSITLNPDLFPGVACPENEEAGMSFGVRMVVPREGVKQDFYSLPFPNDLRTTKDGHVDLSSHPRPGPGLIGLDPMDTLYKQIGAEMTGFSNEPTVYLRFTRPLKEDSLQSSGEKQSIFFVDLDTGTAVDFDFAFKADRNKYICGNWLAVHPWWSRPLAFGHTFAVYVTTKVRADLGEDAAGVDEVPEHLDDAAALLGLESSDDPAVQAAAKKYDKLRTYLKAKSIKTSDVIGAAVFTAQDPTRIMKEFRAVAHAAKAPAIVPGSVVVCDGKTKSPCSPSQWDPKAAFDASRDCPKDVSPDFHEIHMLVSLPIYQNGKGPYLFNEAGNLSTTDGDIALDKNGKPVVKSTLPVCFGLSIPKVARPAAGWPVVVYGHGTGGSFRSGISQIGKAMAQLKHDQAKVPTVVLGIDGAMHGQRQYAGRSDAEIIGALKKYGLLDPGPLFYAFANPKAAKGNVYQGAADNFAIVRWAKSLNLKVTGVADNLKFDKTRLTYMGHSQGGTTGPIFAPYEDDLQGAVFSGAGGSLVYSLLNKKSPQDATTGVKLALLELEIDEWHPVLALLQFYFDEVDPLTYGALLYKNPVGKPLHVLHTFGQGDTYTPPETSRVFAASTYGDLALPAPLPNWFDPIDDLGMTTKKLPLSVNVNGVTGVTVQHINDTKNSTNGKAYDGHFVIFRDKTCNAEFISFMASMIATGKPTVAN